MSENNRGKGIAVVTGIVLLFLTFGFGLYAGALNYPDEQRHQPYRYAAYKPAEVDPALPSRLIGPEAQEYRSPCRDPKGASESDLCAQWRAAKAAEDSAFWTKLGFWVGLFGMFGLFWTLYYTREAVADTGKATEAMQESNRIADDLRKIELDKKQAEARRADEAMRAMICKAAHENRNKMVGTEANATFDFSHPLPGEVGLPIILQCNIVNVAASHAVNTSFTGKWVAKAPDGKIIKGKLEPIVPLPPAVTQNGAVASFAIDAPELLDYAPPCYFDLVVWARLEYDTAFGHRKAFRIYYRPRIHVSTEHKVEGAEPEAVYTVIGRRYKIDGRMKPSIHKSSGGAGLIPIEVFLNEIRDA